VSRRWRNWCQNEVYEETKGVGSKDTVKRTKGVIMLFLDRMMSMAEQE